MRTSNSFELAKRRSTLLMTPASNKRQSVYGGGNGTLEGLGSSQTAVSQSQLLSQNLFQGSERRDQRPLRDRNYQTLILEEIFDFLVANKFELEMNHPITKKTLRQPTQKDFVLIFQFLYGRIDPHYKFTRSIEIEVFVLLKILNYPYLDGINRSSISAVGGQNWSAFLGMLYWLVKLNLSLLNLNEDSLIAPDDVFDRVFIKYIISSYRAFIDQKEDYAEFYDEMKQAFDLANDDVILALEEKKKAGETLRAQLDQLNDQHIELEEAEAKSKALENDLKQFSNYMMQMESRQAKWGDILQQMQAGIEQAEQQLLELEAEKKSYENLIATKGYSISDIDKLNLERDKLSKAIDSVSNKIKDVEDSMVNKDHDLRQSLQSLESFVNQYNLMTQRIPVSENQLFELSINPSVVEENAKFEPENILNRTLRDEKIRLLQSRSELTQEIHRIQEENFKTGEQVDQYSEKIFDQQEYIEGLEAEVTKNKLTHDEILDTMLSEGTSYTAQIEKMQRELQGMQINVNKGVIDAETRNKELTIMFQELKYHIKEQREVMHDTVQKLINYVILFKLNVQDNIEELDKLTVRELEIEQQTS